MSSSSTFYADAVLFDMDGTLTDSIAAVEAAWGKVAADLGLDPEFVIAATHGKRAIDNLKQFKPYIPDAEIDREVEAFEQTILHYADAFSRHAVDTELETATFQTAVSDDSTPELSLGSSLDSSAALSRRSSTVDIPSDRRPSFVTRLSEALMSLPSSPFINQVDENAAMEGFSPAERKLEKDVGVAVLAEWELEAATVDRSVCILPGVKKMIESIPDGHYAVATSGAKTYAYGCMTRVGITPPPVTITADDKRLKAGKPAPDPFLLAAQCLGFSASNCVVFEDSPSGIKAGVASGATVIAVCTSHSRDKIENCGAHYIVENMEKVRCEVIRMGEEKKLRFTVLA